MKTDTINRMWHSTRNLFILLLSLAIFGCQVEPDPDEDEPVKDFEFKNEATTYRDLRGELAFNEYSPRGVGGGGAMSGFSISPYSTMWYVGTDMGTLFKSKNEGKSWSAVFQKETIFSSDLNTSVPVGFFSDGLSVIHAPGGRNAVLSKDDGDTWNPVNIPLRDGEVIKEWRGDSYQAKKLYALTNLGLLKTSDQGSSWERVLNQAPVGLFLEYPVDGATRIYAALKSKIILSEDVGKSWKDFYLANGHEIRLFAGGRDVDGITLVYADNLGSEACQDVENYRNSWGNASIDNHYLHCGHLRYFTSEESSPQAPISFVKTEQRVGDHLKMAENNSKNIVAAGSRQWIRQYGTKVWQSKNGGLDFDLVFYQLNWDVVPFAPWDPNKVEYSAVALNIGWYDDGYTSFGINLRNASEFGGTGYFFLHTTQNEGSNWQAPFTEVKEGSSRGPASEWVSTGLEVTTVYKLKVNPYQESDLYAAMADISGVISEDGGQSFRITSTGHNSIYDYSFNPYDSDVIYASAGNEHDYPFAWHANPTKSSGGIFKSLNKGKNWQRITPNNDDYNRQFLSVAYNAVTDEIYGGTHSLGITLSRDGGLTWQYDNTGLPSGALIIPQIEFDPLSGATYALVTGNAPEFTNHKQTGIYKKERGGSQWNLLRGNVERPTGVTGELWYYPTAFAIDFSDGGDRETIFLVDYENNRNWLATGVWKSTDGGDNWYRTTQYTHPLGISISPHNPNDIYVSGLYQLDGNWGNGGAYFSKDGGESWKINEKIPFQSNGRSVTLDPADPTKIFYNFFGAGMLYGPIPF